MYVLSHGCDIKALFSFLLIQETVVNKQHDFFLKKTEIFCIVSPYAPFFQKNEIQHTFSDNNFWCKKIYQTIRSDLIVCSISKSSNCMYKQLVHTIQ